MRIRDKLLLCFLSLSSLTVIVGLVFYFQLKNLITPLTPQSIPQSVNQLANAIHLNDFVYRLSYQQLVVEHSLENYILTKNTASLQNYYRDQEVFSELKRKAVITTPTLWNETETLFALISNQQAQALQAMQQNKVDDAKNLLNSSQHKETMQRVNHILNRFYQEFDANNETAAVTAKLAAKNTVKILQDSLTTTLILFFDAIIISLLFAFFSARAISRPINLLRNDIERMSRENLYVPLHTNLFKLSGEVGDLARSFYELIQKLRNTTVLRNELLLEVEQRKNSELELQQTAQRLQLSNLELDQFAYVASHDLRAPLRGIANVTTWLEEDKDNVLSEQSKEYIQLIKSRVARLDNLISGILEYSRTNKLSSNFEKINLNILLPEIIDTLSPPTRFHIILDQQLPIVTANKIAITQVFLNLISNAIKHHDKAEAHINIGYKSIENAYQFYVHDDGPGIDPQFHQKIFDLFQTLQPHDTSESTGIGLTLVKKIIEKQGGKIWVNSSLGQPTTFYFTYPKVSQ